MEKNWVVVSSGHKFDLKWQRILEWCHCCVYRKLDVHRATCMWIHTQLTVALLRIHIENAIFILKDCWKEIVQISKEQTCDAHVSCNASYDNIILYHNTSYLLNVAQCAWECGTQHTHYTLYHFTQRVLACKMVRYFTKYHVLTFIVLIQ